MNFSVLDERKVWHASIIRAARNHGYNAKRIFKGEEAFEDGVGFIRPHVEPNVLKRNQIDFIQMRSRLNMIQDATQVELYEDKSGQFKLWHDWMPETWRFTDKESALAFLDEASYPLVSKADVGASSVNVRILKSKDEAQRHVTKLFTSGIVVEHSSECKTSIQLGYALLQKFIPHQITWRVNAIGDARAIFKRYCYKDRPVAQTGNVDPVLEMTEECESLLEYCNRFFEHAKTKWCAIDVLKEGMEWKLLETSLAWPWPSPGQCMKAPLFGTKKTWTDMFEVMFDEYAEGAWGA